MTNQDIPIKHYQEQLARGFRLLRFKPELERPYRAEHALKHRSKQLATIAVAMVILILLFPVDLESLPPSVTPMYFLFRLGLAVPFLVFVTACHFMEDLKRHVTAASIGAVMVISLGTILLYVTSSYENYRFPYEGLILIMMVTFFMAGLRFWVALGTTVITLAAFQFASHFLMAPGYHQPTHAFYLLATVLCGATGAYSVEYQKRKSFLQNGIVQDLAIKDGLTQLYNRSAIMEKLEDLLLYAKRERKYLTLYLADIDCFKEYNDNYGHLAGDKCLIQVADTLHSCCQRNLDFAGRYGGEEFLLVWFDTNPLESHALINRVHEKINNLNITHDYSSAAPHITVSGGFINLIPDEHTDVETLLHHADMALYNAKRRGRNQVSQVATPEYA
ncbi:MAG: GGDEF domain-containing protein [Ketobacteraceae bacterium]|nr:GGDEF domain-containing protein [Ketobacteraceae bacterium]